MSEHDDPHRLERFVDAQDDATYAQVLVELRAGRKRSHWMWFVFPQLAGLGRSPTAQHFAIASLDEARAYIAHPLLGPRLAECAQLVAASATSDAQTFFGGIDAVKLRSSMTLFDLVADAAVFGDVLARYFHGERDPQTLRLAGADPT
ncbi:Uncharacterized protein, DUF1810 family [Jatrophihabitans endophyticus]|uniref:Uncharacterized protein, DUF1810 family n=1 Tax=Jatrophihabitans endophyticus TaxID=1206085 RepID=A0A1M5I984_9ACTN|nr:DUF1810 domain-containing protein [Jatrophihabitans endophyticus]SHG24958.1 Uncharacterized protein, DUF1810 family [Jatrophihabitans endophyticus]